MNGRDSFLRPRSLRDSSFVSRAGWPPLSKERHVNRATALLRLLSEPRYHIVIACFFATFAAYVERIGFSVAYTALAKQAGVEESVKGAVMSAFYWGYGLSQVPGGWAAQRFGGRLTLAACFAAWSLASLLTPTNPSRTHLVMAARVVVGVSQGFLIPAVHTLLSQWIPASERARCVSLATSGMYLGSAGAMWMLPTVAARLGPGAIFKVDALVGAAWLAVWLVIGHDQPPNAAAQYIPITAQDDKLGPRPPPMRKAAAAPWGLIIRQSAIWAIVVNNFTFHYAFFMVMNWLPTYFQGRLGANLESMGAAKVAPYLLMFVASNAGGWAGDYLIIHRRFTVARARKAVNTAGFITGSAALMWMAAAHTPTTGVLATCAALACLGVARGGFSVNHMDVAPKHAGMVMAISNTAGTLSGVISVAVTGFILEQHGGSSSAAGWTGALGVAACNCIAGILVFNAFGKGERVLN